MMHPLAWSWIIFIGAWKAIPSRQDDLTASDIALSLAFLFSLLLILYPSQSKEFRPVCFVLPFFAAAFIARASLGDNWGVPSKRVKTGLYSIVDHPIYFAVFVAGVISAFHTRSPNSIIGIGLLGATLATAAYIDDAKLTELGE